MILGTDEGSGSVMARREEFHRWTGWGGEEEAGAPAVRGRPEDEGGAEVEPVDAGEARTMWDEVPRSPTRAPSSDPLSTSEGEAASTDGRRRRTGGDGLEERDDDDGGAHERIHEMLDSGDAA
ncbi:uncharacterized protein A4U43_C03F30380 [Asparagus officinalis]|uniref:Uncharacterized protein n=1 Tax=Asparagus officinalis TaxID=4686 RepID=A0A5P1FF07_ASPOF|nr:uncharacterized protein A4U43_C03F30380 [Asparagus officinalis]